MPRLRGIVDAVVIGEEACAADLARHAAGLFA